MTVPHGLRSSWEREQRRRELVEQAIAATDLDTDRAILASVDREDWFGAHRGLRPDTPPDDLWTEVLEAGLLAA